MKLAIFIYSLAGGGAERVVSQLIPYLEKKNIEVFLVMMNKTIEYRLEIANEPHYLENSNPNENGFLKLIKIPLLAYKYHVFLKNNGIEKTFSFLTRPSIISILTKFFNTKRIIFISERSNPSNQYGYNNLQSWISTILIKKLYPKANLIITNSIGNAFDLIHNFHIPNSKIETIYNPVDIEFISTIEPIIDFFDKEYFNLISIGRLDIGKNHSLLIRAMSKLPSKKVRLYIFGTGELFKEMDELILELNLTKNVFLMGFDSNPYRYLKSADLFVFGSNHEGFPNVLLEAMACELPIVSTNCPSGPNEILEEKINYSNDKNIITNYGILVPLNDENSMVDAINYMILNENYYFNCKISISERIKDFNKDLILQKYYDILSSK
jgi:glycosyltransferase involved in cell wall biosynthesis